MRIARRGAGVLAGWPGVRPAAYPPDPNIVPSAAAPRTRAEPAGETPALRARRHLVYPDGLPDLIRRGGLPMSDSQGKWTRRRFLETVGRVGGAAAVYESMVALGIVRVP